MGAILCLSNLGSSLYIADNDDSHMAKGRKIQYRDFEEAREFARSLNLRNKDEWTRYAKGELEGFEPKPKDIPSRVDKIYKGNGWIGFDDFLSSQKNKEVRKNFRSFEQSRNFVRSLRLGREENWRLYIEGKLKADKGTLPADVPPNPEEIYRDKGWIGWSDWVSDHYAPETVEYKNFDDAREFVKTLNLKSIHEWEAYRNGEDHSRGPCPKDIPVWPPSAYKNNGWTSWGDWLGLTFRRS